MGDEAQSVDVAVHPQSIPAVGLPGGATTDSAQTLVEVTISPELVMWIIIGSLILLSFCGFACGLTYARRLRRVHPEGVECVEESSKNMPKNLTILDQNAQPPLFEVKRISGAHARYFTPQPPRDEPKSPGRVG